MSQEEPSTPCSSSTAVVALASGARGSQEAALRKTSSARADSNTNSTTGGKPLWSLAA